MQSAPDISGIFPGVPHLFIFPREGFSLVVKGQVELARRRCSHWHPWRSSVEEMIVTERTPCLTTWVGTAWQDDARHPRPWPHAGTMLHAVQLLPFPRMSALPQG